MLGRLSTGSVRRGVTALGFREGRTALARRVLPSQVHQSLLRRLSPSIVVDVGANRGQFSLDVRRAAPSARVVAFEPLAPEAATYRSIFARTPGYVLHEVALGSAAGRQPLHVSAARDSSSLLPIGRLQEEVFPGTHEVAVETVEVRTLDDFVDEFGGAEPALLKIDVQGGELDVLRGAATSLDRFRWLYLEASFVELYDGQPLADVVIDELGTHGFNLRSVGRPTMANGLSVQADLLFEHR